MKCLIMLSLTSVLLFAGCNKKGFEDSAYVLIRNSTYNSSTPALGAYFVGEDAQLNGISCREILGLANEAVQARIDRGEIHLVKYECVSLAEARKRGFN